MPPSRYCRSKISRREAFGTNISLFFARRTRVVSMCSYGSQTSRQRVLCSYLIPLFNRRSEDAALVENVASSGVSAPVGSTRESAPEVSRATDLARATLGSAPTGSQAPADGASTQRLEGLAVPSLEAEELADPDFRDYNDDDEYSVEEEVRLLRISSRTALVILVCFMVQTSESFFRRQAQAAAKRQERLEAIRSEMLAAEAKYESCFAPFLSVLLIFGVHLQFYRKAQDDVPRHVEAIVTAA
jgi:hypothetical protein